MCKKFIPILIVCAVLSCITAVASGGAEFALSDVNVKNNRIFESRLSVKSDAEISAFVAEIRYDETKVQFRKAKARDDSYISVNDSQKGVVRVAFFCEEGINCQSGDTPITFSFKSLGASGRLELFVEQVADTNAKDVLVTACRDSVLSAGESADSDTSKNEKDSSGSADKSSKPDSEDDTETEGTEALVDASGSPEAVGRVDFVSDTGDGRMIILLVSLGALIVFGASAVAFILGRKSRDRK